LNSGGELLDSILQDPDLTGFKEPLEVWVEKWGDEGRTDHPIRFYVDESSAGNHTIYSSTRTIDPGCQYRLFVNNPQTDKSLTATCYTVDTENLHFSIDNTYSSVTVQSLDSVYYYQTELFFCFVEVSPGDTVYCRIPLFKHTLTNETKKAGAIKVLSLDRPEVLEYIGNSIAPSPDVRRYARKRPYDFRLILGDEVLFDYLNTLYGSEQKFQATQPISNIRGGKGIFSSVHRKSLGSIYMKDYWYVSLSENEYTKYLNFQPKSWYE
jgi:hypothetical protein